MKLLKSTEDLEGLRKARDQVSEALLKVTEALSSLSEPYLEPCPEETKDSFLWWWGRYKPLLKELVEGMSITLRIEELLLTGSHREEDNLLSNWRCVKSPPSECLFKAWSLLNQASDYMGHLFGDVWFGSLSHPLPPWGAHLEQVGYRFYAEWPCMGSILKRIALELEESKSTILNRKERGR